MKFKPFSKKYNFIQDVLIKDFPQYLHDPVDDWLWRVLNSANVVGVDDSYLTRSKRYIKTAFLNRLQIYFREVFPQYWDQFITFIFSDSDRTSNFLAFCLQNFADQDDALQLEYILSQGGSGYEVTKTQKDANEYEEGVYDLTERVPDLVKNQSMQAIDENDLLMEAWIHCYARNPDYEKVVIKCQNFLEHFLRDTYEPENTKPQLGKIIGNLKSSSQKLKYKGESVLPDKKIILSLIDNIPQFRGMHTAGTGKSPSKEDAEFVLHTTIYVWNLHQK